MTNHATEERRRADVVQEDDRMDARKAWTWTAATFVASALLCVAAWLVLRAFEGGAGTPGPAPVPAGAGAPAGVSAASTPRVRGEPFDARVRRRDTVPAAEEEDDWAWVDRDAGIARVSVPTAMELLVEMEGPARATEPTAPAPPPPRDTARQAPPRDTSARPPAPDTASPVPVAGDTLPRPPGPGRHPTLSRVDVELRPGTKLPLDVRFTDAAGATAPLGAAFTGARPVLVVPGWYRCRMLCGTVMDGLADAVAALEERSDMRPGRDFAVVALGIDPREGPADARTRRERVRNRLGEPEDADLDGWTFLTGPDGAARRVADSLGFRYAYDPDTDQYAHAAAVFAVSPTGSVTGALYGVSFDPDDVETALDRAAAEKPGLSLEKVLVRCFRFTPALQRHAGVIAGVLKGGGVLILLGLAGIFVLAGRKAARREPA